MCYLVGDDKMVASNTASSPDDDFNALWAKASEHWSRNAVGGELVVNDGVKISYVRLDVGEPIAVVVVATGRSECYLKYKDLAFQLNAANYSVLLYDHRGQGLSDRLLADPRKGHVDNFGDYVSDLKHLYATQIEPKHPGKKILLAHSMGGTIAALYAIKNPADFAALILSSPMLGLPSGALGHLFSRTVKRIEKLLDSLFGVEPTYIPGAGRYAALPFAENKLTHSRERYENTVRLSRENPTIALHAPTTHWVSEAYRAIDCVFAELANIQLPTLVLQAGADQVVTNAAQDIFCQNLKSCIGQKPIRIAGAHHELLNESDEFRTPAIRHILKFIDAIAKKN